MEFFSDAKGQLTPQSVFGFGQNLKPVESLWLPRLLARIKIEDPIKNEGSRLATM